MNTCKERTPHQLHTTSSELRVMNGVVPELCELLRDSNNKSSRELALAAAALRLGLARNAEHSRPRFKL